MGSGRRLQWQAEVVIAAGLERTWAAIDDLSLIPSYHPVVRRVEFPSGVTRRAPGVEYRCVIPAGRRRGWCVEKVIDHVPLRRSTVAFTADSWGLGRLVADFVTEVAVEPAGAGTRVVLRGSYAPRGWRGAVLNALVVRRAMRRRAADTLRGLKGWLEGPDSTPSGTAEPGAAADPRRQSGPGG